MHPVWLRCENSEYPDIPAFSRLARRAPQRPKLRTYFFVNPKLIGSVLPVSFYWLDCPFSGRRMTSTGFLQRRRTRRDVLPITTCSNIPCP